MMHDKRLIDANALINVLHAKLCSIDNGRTMMQAAIPVADGMRIMELEYCIGLIQCADIIDAVEVVHAKWVWTQRGWCCSACCKPSLIEAVAFAKWCPRCGAKMDGGGTDGSDT